MLLNDISSYIKSHQIMWMEGEKERVQVVSIGFVFWWFLFWSAASIALVIKRNKIESMKL